MFLSNYNIFIGMLLGPTDLFELSKAIMFCISDLMVRLRKKEFCCLFFRKSEEFLCEGLILFFLFSAVVAKYLLKAFEICTWLVTVAP